MCNKKPWKGLDRRSSARAPGKKDLFSEVRGLISLENQLGFQGGSEAKTLPANQETQVMWVLSLGGEDPLEKVMATHSSILAWEIP